MQQRHERVGVGGALGLGPLLHVGDRSAERQRLLRRDGEEVEREPLGGPSPDPGQPGQLGDEVVDGRAQHGMRLLVQIGRAGHQIGRACCIQGHFGQAFDIKTADGRPAHTACIGFGLERIALALFKTHGFDPAQWPSDVKRVLA